MRSTPQALYLGRWKMAGLFFSFWTLVSFLTAAEHYAGQMMVDKPVSWGMAFRRAFEQWYTWGAISLGVLWLAERWHHFDRGRGRGWFLIHGLASLAVNFVYATIYAWLLEGQRSIMDGTIFTFPDVYRKMVIHYCVINMLIYWMIVLAHHGWHYYQRFRERELQASALAAELVQARLEVLRMQLNPHFLFNTLHTISALIHENPEDADRIVARLSDLLRVSLEQSDTQEVPLRQELAFLQRYLEIEQTRFQDRLTVEMEIESGLEELLVPSLILQPLVENAIRHGIEPREDMGRVKISARRLNEMLELRVSDNGPGLPETEAAPHREGVGLSNTRSRLSHLYGASHQFELAPATGGGLEARLLIPCRTVPNQYTPKVMIVPKAEAVVGTSGLNGTIAGQPQR